jgi:hypothetical protein
LILRLAVRFIGKADQRLQTGRAKNFPIPGGGEDFQVANGERAPRSDRRLMAGPRTLFVPAGARRRAVIEKISAVGDDLSGWGMIA